MLAISVFQPSSWDGVVLREQGKIICARRLRLGLKGSFIKIAGSEFVCLLVPTDPNVTWDPFDRRHLQPSWQGIGFLYNSLGESGRCVNAGKFIDSLQGVCVHLSLSCLRWFRFRQTMVMAKAVISASSFGVTECGCPARCWVRVTLSHAMVWCA